jgi:hypothetical protein
MSASDRERMALQLSFRSLPDSFSPLIIAENDAVGGLLLRKYFDQPMSLTDACIVRMAELNQRHFIFTLDSDFAIYRKHGNESLKLIAPER